MEPLREWFLTNRRSFPWREERTPYAVWVSEVMLQQTRASVVVDYFLRWMQKFPTIEELSQAPLAEVIKAWEGLGYYSRARRLHEAAKELKGRPFPSCREELLSVKGIGTYTAGAILSFAFHERSLAIDGNVERVLLRYFALEGKVPRRVLEEKAELMLPQREPWVVMEALIELGATVCGRRPLCHDCPLAESCQARLQEKTEQIPPKKKRKQIEFLSSAIYLLVHDGSLLIEKKKEKGRFGDLSRLPSFPYAEGGEAWNLEKRLGLLTTWQADLKEEVQHFTLYEETLYPSLYLVRERRQVEGYLWVTVEDLVDLAFPSGHKRVLEQLLESDVTLSLLPV